MLQAKEKPTNLKKDKDWENALIELKKIIDKNPEIIIQQKLLKIPKLKREEFYEKFDQVRNLFIINYFSYYFENSKKLSKNYLELEKKLIEELSLTKINMSNNIYRFLHNPIKQLRRVIFDLLIDLIMNKISKEEFIKEGKEKIKKEFNKIYNIAFQKYFILLLVDFFEAAEIYNVPLNVPTSTELIKHPVGSKEAVPEPQKTKEISFEVPRRTTIIVPDFIIYSSKLEKYISFRTVLGRAIWEASSVNRERDWLLIEDIIKNHGSTQITPSLMIFIDDNIENISYVADSKRIAVPDFIFEVLDRYNKKRKIKIEKLRKYNKILEPKYGSYFVENFKKEMLAKNGENELNSLVIDAGINHLNKNELNKILENYKNNN
jgi:hypothetical protein